jgi:hypothetical protein
VNGTGEVDATVGCPNANRTLAVAARAPTVCEIDTVLADYRRTKVNALKADFAGWARTHLTTSLSDGYSPAQAAEILRHDISSYLTRSNAIIDKAFADAEQRKPYSVLDTVGRLNTPGGQPPYVGNYRFPLADARHIWIGHLTNAIRDYEVFLDYRRCRCRLAVGSSADALVGPLASKRVRVRAGQRVRVRLHLSRRAIQQLTRGVAKRKAVAVRLMITYKTRGLPVLWLTDFSIRVVTTKPKPRRR